MENVESYLKIVQLRAHEWMYPLPPLVMSGGKHKQCPLCACGCHGSPVWTLRWSAACCPRTPSAPSPCSCGTTVCNCVRCCCPSGGVLARGSRSQIPSWPLAAGGKGGRADGIRRRRSPERRATLRHARSKPRAPRSPCASSSWWKSSALRRLSRRLSWVPVWSPLSPAPNTGPAPDTHSDYGDAPGSPAEPPHSRGNTVWSKEGTAPEICRRPAPSSSAAGTWRVGVSRGAPELWRPSRPPTRGPASPRSAPAGSGDLWISPPTKAGSELVSSWSSWSEGRRASRSSGWAPLPRGSEGPGVGSGPEFWEGEARGHKCPEDEWSWSGWSARRHRVHWRTEAGSRSFHQNRPCWSHWTRPGTQSSKRCITHLLRNCTCKYIPSTLLSLRDKTASTWQECQSNF